MCRHEVRLSVCLAIVSGSICQTCLVSCLRHTRRVLGGLPEEKHGKSGRETENKSKVQRELEIVSNRVSIARTLREKKD